MLIDQIFDICTLRVVCCWLQEDHVRALQETVRKLSQQHPELTLTVQVEGHVVVLRGGEEQPSPLLPWPHLPYVASMRSLRHSSHGASSPLTLSSCSACVYN